MTVRMMALGVVCAALLVGCTSKTEAAPPTPSTTSAAPTTPADPYDVYLGSLAKQSLLPKVQRGEAVSVAGNTCDNTVADMSGLINGLRSIYPDPQQMRDFVTDRALFIDAYCPSIRPVFDAAAQKELGYTATVR